MKNNRRFLCIYFLLAFGALSILFPTGAFCLDVTVTLTNNTKHMGTLEKMGDDGSITLKIEGGTTVYKRDQYLKVESTETPSEISAGEQQYKARDYAGALKNYQSAYEKYKWLNWGETALGGIGDCYLGQGENEKALATYNKFLKQYPRAAKTYSVKYNMALSYRATGKKTESLASFSEVADNTDDVYTVYALSNMGELQFEQGDYHQALRSFLRVIILYEGTPNSDVKVREAKVNAAKCYDKIIENTTSQTERDALRQEKERIIK